jgi:polar amino acid transport system substrate-binding protein
MRTTPYLFVGCLALLWGGFASAKCSRTIIVPAASTGYSVIVRGETVSGVYPDVLQELGKKSGCTFAFPAVPRARLEQMFFKAGTADLLIPATRTDERDQLASFVPLIKVVPGLVTLDGKPIKIATVSQLLEAKQLRGATVRGFNYGQQYQTLLGTLESENRIDYVPNLVNVTSMMARGRVDFSIVAPTLFYSTVAEDPESKAILGQIRYKALEGLDQVESGVYLSTQSLSAQDLAEVRKILDEAVRNGLLWKAFQAYYPAEILNGVVTRR